MGSQVVPIRLKREVLAFIDTLVKLGVYKSRSEALRELIEAGVEELQWTGKVFEAVEELFEIEREEGDVPVKLEGALRQLLEERGRF